MFPVERDIRLLNVSGRHFEVDREILERSEFFLGAFEDCPHAGKKEPLYLPRSPMLFEHVLAYMIDPNYLYPLKVECEIKYFSLPLTPLKRPDYRGLPGPRGPPGRDGKDGKDVTNYSSCSAKSGKSVPKNDCHSIKSGSKDGRCGPSFSRGCGC